MSRKWTEEDQYYAEMWACQRDATRYRPGGIFGFICTLVTWCFITLCASPLIVLIVAFIYVTAGGK